MRYFQSFPIATYHTSEVVNGRTQRFIRSVPNMTLQFQVQYQNGSYTWYTIQDRDRPDTVAAQWYGSSQYTWVVLLSNGMKDIYDWPMSTLQFYDYMNEKYETAVGLNDGVAASRVTPYAYLWCDPVSNEELVVDEVFYNTEPSGLRRIQYLYEYEDELNNQRRRIKQLSVETFRSFVLQFQQLVSRNE